MRPLSHALLTWLPFGVLATFMSALVFVATWQSLRLSADDPQIELARTTAILLNAGQPAEIFGASANVDVSTSLLPFLIVYDLNGNVIHGTGILDGAIPVPPMGVLLSAQERGENRLTWEPARNVRVAAIVIPFKGKQTGYVLAGKSLKEVDARISEIMFYVFIFWIVSMLSTFLLVWIKPAAVTRHTFE